MIVIGTQIKNKFSMHLHGKLIFLSAVLLHMWKVGVAQRDCAIAVSERGNGRHVWGKGRCESHFLTGYGMGEFHVVGM